MRLQFQTLLALLIPALVAIGPESRAQSVDPHDLYERRCSGCHTEHAGAFVQESILRAEGQLVGRNSGLDVQAFLSRGHGKLSAAEVEVMMRHLTSILNADALFRDNCVICHGRGVLFARGHLGIKDGVLVGRYSGRAVEDFLETHGRLEAAEIGVVVKALSNQVTGKAYRMN